MWENHNGLDIAIEEGTGAKAVLSGIVVEVRTSDTLGNVISYRTVNGYKITYAHLKTALKKVGDFVNQGDIIAYTGNTGLSTGPHLHYSVQWDGRYIDPYPLVDLEYTSEVEGEYAARGDSIN